MADEDTGTQEVAEQTAAPDIETELGEIFDKANAEETQDTTTSERPRGPDGKFIAKEAAEDAPVAKVETPEQPQVEVKPPPSWLSETAKAKWANIDPEFQQDLLKQEAEWQKADTERTNRLKTYEPYDQALAPVRQMLELQGVPPQQYVGQLVAADMFLRKDGPNALKYIAQQYGIDLQQLVQTQDPQIDPALAPLVQEITSIKSYLKNSVAAQQQRERDSMNALVTSFSSDPKHKHYGEVEADMLAMLPAVMAQNPGKSPTDILTLAYNKAVWANDSVRAKLQAEQSTEAEKKRQDEAAKKASEAKRISQTNLNQRGTAAGQTPVKQNIEEELGDIYDRVSAA